MKALIVFTSIRVTDNFAKYASNFSKYQHDPDIIVVDEDADNRKVVQKQLNDFKVDFYGMQERASWFNSHKMSGYKSVLPAQAHNENSFALLIALERADYDMIVFVDDDTYPVDCADFLGTHWKALNTKSLMRRSNGGCWVNTHPQYYARGFPYNQRRIKSTWGLPNLYDCTVLNMGCWLGIPDLNAVDYLALNPFWVNQLNIEAFTVAPKNYAPVCSMNVAFRPEIIPAYYQLWHRDRYDDIFSGLLLKTVADHLKKGLSVGEPLCVHDKEPRDYFHDLETELPSMRLNEELYKALLDIHLTEKTWLSCYRELTLQLKQKAKHLSPHYITVLSDKMLQWCELVEKVML